LDVIFSLKEFISLLSVTSASDSMLFVTLTYGLLLMNDYSDVARL